MQRLLYISTARSTLGDAELDAILRISRRNNAKVGVTGLLVVGGRRFLQMLEGTEEGVSGVFERIRRDPRHFAVVTLSRKSIEHRITAGWSMGFRQATLANEEGETLPDIVSRLVAQIEDPALRAEFTQFAIRHAAA